MWKHFKPFITLMYKTIIVKYMQKKDNHDFMIEALI